jgi:hypothetical protein
MSFLKSWSKKGAVNFVPALLFSIGSLLAKLNDDVHQDYAYDNGDRLLSIKHKPTDLGRKLGVTAEKTDFA